MDSDWTEWPREVPGVAFEDTGFCWKEMLAAALIGWPPVDQAFEHIMDRIERTP